MRLLGLLLALGLLAGCTAPAYGCWPVTTHDGDHLLYCKPLTNGSGD